MEFNLETFGINQLSVTERLILVQQIWDSIAADIAQSPLTETETAEVDRRLAAHADNPDAAIPWNHETHLAD